MSTIPLSMSAAAITLLLAAGPVMATQDEASVAKGKALFNDPAFGTNGKTCNGCHKDGAGLDQAAARQDIEKVVNSCIQAALKGKALEPGSAAMQSLVLYLKSLGGGKKAATK
ncbi:MAG: cytochrome C [Nitrospirota bacterium]